IRAMPDIERDRAFAPRFLERVGDEHTVTVRGRRPVHPSQHLVIHRVRQIGNDHADRLARPQRERTRRLTGAVRDLVAEGAHALRDVFVDGREAVDHARDRRVGDAGELRDVGYPHRAHGVLTNALVPHAAPPRAPRRHRLHHVQARHDARPAVGVASQSGLEASSYKEETDYLPGAPMPHILEVGNDADLLPSLTLALEDESATEIVLHPGTYVERVVVAPRRAPLLIRSATADPADVVISFGLRQGDRDRTGMPFVQDCATLTIAADDVTLRGITVENTFDKRIDPDLPDQQALALRTLGDRILVEDCRLLGQQDTVLLDAPSFAAVRRVHLRDCLITGDVDFVYGRATALIEGGEIRSVGDGYVAAPSTAIENEHGFLFWGVRLTNEGLEPGSVHLGRPWHPGGKPDAIGQAIFARCDLGEHISRDPWSEMGGFAWEDAR